jgi:hypothetical protein
MIEVIPQVKGRTYSETIFYTRVKIESLTQEKLYSIFKLSNDKTPSVTDIGDFFVYQYYEKPSVFISKKNGKICGLNDDHLTRLQTIFLLQKLEKFNLVEGYDRKQKHRGKLSFMVNHRIR